MSSSQFNVGDAVTTKASSVPRMTIHTFLADPPSLGFKTEKTNWVLCTYYNHLTATFEQQKFNINELNAV